MTFGVLIAEKPVECDGWFRITEWTQLGTFALRERLTVLR